MLVVFQGIESHDHRATLESVPELFQEDQHIRVVAGLSFSAMRRRRLGEAYVKETAGKFPVLLEAGVSTRPMDRDKLRETEEEYYAFLASCPEITSAVQFDHPSLRGEDSPIKVEDPRVIPVLHDPQPGVLAQVLETEMAVAMPMVKDSGLIAVLRALTADDARLALALAQPDLKAAKQAGFNAIMTTAWVAPGRYGEISVWDGAKFHRSNSENKARVIRTYSHQIESYGLDIDMVTKGDPRECNRLAAYSILSWALSLAEPTQISDQETPDKAQERPSEPFSSAHPVPAPSTAPRAVVPFPGFFSQGVSGMDTDAEGREVIRELPLLRTTSAGVRQCTGCYLATTCPAYEPGASCKFNFPVEVRTDAQAKAVLHSMVEMQASRVAFARFAEEVNGGYPDPVVGEEIDRLVRMTDRVLRSERRERLTVSVESESSGGGTGVLSKFFGNAPAAPPTPQPAIIVAQPVEE